MSTGGIPEWVLTISASVCWFDIWWNRGNKKNPSEQQYWTVATPLWSKHQQPHWCAFDKDVLSHKWGLEDGHFQGAVNSVARISSETHICFPNMWVWSLSWLATSWSKDTVSAGGRGQCQTQSCPGGQSFMLQMRQRRKTEGLSRSLSRDNFLSLMRIPIAGPLLLEAGHDALLTRSI